MTPLKIIRTTLVSVISDNLAGVLDFLIYFRINTIYYIVVKDVKSDWLIGRHAH